MLASQSRKLSTMEFRYVASNLGPVLGSVSEEEFSRSKLSPGKYYVHEKVLCLDKVLFFNTFSPDAYEKQEIELRSIKPILGLGIRAFFKRFLESSSLSTLKARADRDLASLTILEETFFNDKGGAALLSIAGLALVGPVGAIAGLAAKQKGEAIFMIEFKDNIPEKDLCGMKVIACSSVENFKQLKLQSRAPSKSTAEAIENKSLLQSSGGTSLASEIEKLKALLDSGAITLEEYSAAKTRLLSM